MRTWPIALGALTLLLGLSLAASEADAQRRHRRGPDGSQWFTIVSEGGLCLDVHGAQAGQNGARVQMWTCNGGPNQLWRFDGAMLVNAAGGCLDVHGGDLRRLGRRGGLARVTTFQCHGRQNQRWRAERNGAFVSATGGCLDVEGAAIHRVGTRVISYPCHGRANQRFRMVPARRRRVPRRPPPRVVAPSPMDQASFTAFIARLENISFSSERVAAVRTTAPHAWFSAAQIARVITVMSFSSERTAVIDLLVPRLVDRHNGHVIVQSLTFSSEREHARQVLARYAQVRPGG